jgi:hypothetical protein
MFALDLTQTGLILSHLITARNSVVVKKLLISGSIDANCQSRSSDYAMNYQLKDFRMSRLLGDVTHQLIKLDTVNIECILIQDLNAVISKILMGNSSLRVLRLSGCSDSLVMDEDFFTKFEMSVNRLEVVDLSFNGAVIQEQEGIYQLLAFLLRFTEVSLQGNSLFLLNLFEDADSLQSTTDRFSAQIEREINR